MLDKNTEQMLVKIHQCTVLDNFKFNHFYPFLGHLIQHLAFRFPEQLEDVLEGTYLLPGNHDYLKRKPIKTFSHDLP